MSDTFATDWENAALANARTGSSPVQAAGLIRGYDLDPARNPARFPGSTTLTAIQHMLRFATDIKYYKSNVPQTDPTYGGTGPNGTLNPSGWPNLYQDYQTTGQTYTGNFLYGTTVGIPITTPMPTNLTDAGKQLWWTFQHYGGIPRDAGSGGGVILYTDQTVSAAWIAQADIDMPTIVQALCPMRNQHLGGQSYVTSPMQGPGTPLDVGPPPLAALTAPPAAGESAEGTLLSTTTGTTIIDAAGVHWALVTSTSSGLQITRNGVLDTTTANVSFMGYYGHKLYQQNAAGNWYVSSGAIGVWTQVPDPRAVVTGNFSVFNGQVLDPTGVVFKARGIDVYDSQQGVVSTNALGQPMRTLFPTLSFVRLATFQYSPVSYFTTFINQMTALKIVVLIEHHSGAGGGVAPLTGQALIDENAWFATLATAFKANPYVWFGTLNEPAGPGPDLTAEQVSNYNTIRATGNNNIVVFQPLNDFSSGSLAFGTNGGANGLTWSAYSTMKNVIWDFHYYNWPTGYSTDLTTNVNAIIKYAGQIRQITSADGVMPIIIGEFGNSTNGTTVDAGGAVTIQAVLQQAKTTGFVGCVAWAWRPGTADDLTDGANNLTSDFGVPVAAGYASGW